MNRQFTLRILLVGVCFAPSSLVRAAPNWRKTVQPTQMCGFLRSDS